MNSQEIMAELEKLRAENESLKAKRGGGKLSLKVSSKGGVSLYGINSRFPVSLYKGQWERVIDFAPTIAQFLKDHEKELAVKEPVK